MERSVLEAVNRFSLLDGAENVTVALSGGADSMSLLYALFSLRKTLGITISAAHLNHMIRGEEALRDENFVKEQCEKLGIILFSERVDVPKYAKEHKISTELAAREVRYEFLERINTGVVATAHTASDNLETLLFNLTRGTALKGICGIPPKRGIFIRPLILTSREEIEKYCETKGIPYVTDSTNLSDDYSRNRLRHNVIPVLKQINPSVEKAAERTAMALSEDESFLAELAEKFLAGNVKNGGLLIDNMPNAAVAKRAVKTFAEKTKSGLTLDSLHISQIYEICLKGNGRVSLPLNMSAEVFNGSLKITDNNADNRSSCRYSVSCEVRNNNLFKKSEKINNLLLNNSLDCDKIMGKSVIRTRQPSDSIRLKGHGCTKSLKKLMNEHKIPREERDFIPLIADERGVVWIYGIGVSQRCAVTEKTEHIMIINVRNEQNKID